MELINATRMAAGYTTGMEPDGRELLVVVVKGTFTIPEPGGEPNLAEKQVPLVEADVFTGEPGFSAPVYESDYAHRKPNCDVLVNGSAYAPGGRPAERVRVSLRVGSLVKAFDVVGKRVWQVGLLSTSPSKAEPYTVMPISYNNAFGGVDKTDDDPPKEHWYLQNHAGVGYHEVLSAKHVEGKPLPNTEETGHPVRRPNGTYEPMAFGPVGRAWQPRAKLAGTYDQQWLDNRCPFWPHDFDYKYFQAAPADQQMPYPVGGERVVLENLSPGGVLEFGLPRVTVPLLFVPEDGPEFMTHAAIDTVLLEPDKRRMMLTWRVSRPLRRSIFDIHHVIVGEKRRRGESFKKRYANLDELIRGQKTFAVP
jgi:hypothetical protein